VDRAEWQMNPQDINAYYNPLNNEIVLSEVHSPDMFRVNGPLPNIDAWSEAFDVQPGDKLYIKPDDRVRIW